MGESTQVVARLFGKIGQERRLLKLDTPLGPDTLLPRRAHGFDRISEGCDYTVDLLSLDRVHRHHALTIEAQILIMEFDARVREGRDARCRESGRLKQRVGHE